MRRQPTIEWQTNGVCNYDCSYCIQSRKFRQGHPADADIDAFLAFFAGLDGLWEIKMSGGEPFAFRGFMERIVPGLALLPHRVSVLTNLSAPLTQLRRFVDLVGDQLSVVSASLHLEYTSVEAFIEKATQLRLWLRPETALVVNSVLVPGTLENLITVRRRIEEAGLRYFPQIMKTKHGIFPYDTSDRLTARALTGESPTSREANLAPSYRGRLCWTGVEYFALEQNGDAWSCRTARRFKQGYLGNVLAGTFKLKRAPARCPYDICPCTVPANRGMIEGVGRAVAVEDV
ncbi:MAG TPA: radical SAM protein [Pyrinomonadaceae bacterium]|jgi:MoaA/NifB/PqqE/SkfB family radical SAM enzyme